MNTFHIPLLLGLLVILFPSSAVSQKKETLPVLREDASLEETKAWLLQAIKIASPYESVITKKNVKIDGHDTNVTEERKRELIRSSFDGCTLSYTFKHAAKITTMSTRDRRITLQRAQPMLNREHSFINKTVSTSFDLSLIDPDRIGVRESVTREDLLNIVLIADDDEEIISETVKGKETLKRPYTVIEIDKGYAAQIKDALIASAKLCRKSN